jgi:tricorn protease
VHGGDTNSPFDGDSKLASLHRPASLGATLQRNAEWKGYKITEIAHRDPDYNLVEDKGVYSPLSDQALRLSGQKGLQVGDVIVGVNGESAFRVPDIHMLLRGRAGHSVRLEVLRLASGDVAVKNTVNGTSPESTVVLPAEEAHPEPVVVVPIEQSAASDLRYNAWEWNTRQKAKSLAQEAGFSVAYIHLRSMGQEDMDAFARSYFEDYDKDSMILDLRHNRGGNIDSWITSFLQRKAWYFFEGRVGNTRGVDTDWNQQFAFKSGHIVVLIDEKTSSDGEGLSRAISELGLGVLIGKRTWGGGIWLSSDNVLVDGGIATAPEDAVYNDKWGWGLGIGKSSDESVRWCKFMSCFCSQ